MGQKQKNQHEFKASWGVELIENKCFFGGVNYSFKLCLSGKLINACICKQITY